MHARHKCIDTNINDTVDVNSGKCATDNEVKPGVYTSENGSV